MNPTGAKEMESMKGKNETLAELLKWLRTELLDEPMNQDAFWGQFDCTGSYGSQLEKGKRTISDELCKQISEALQSQYVQQPDFKGDPAEASAELFCRLRIAAHRMRSPDLVDALEANIRAKLTVEETQPNGEILRERLRDRLAADMIKESDEKTVAGAIGCGLDTLRSVLAGRLPLDRRGIVAAATAMGKDADEYLMLGGFFPGDEPEKFAKLLSICTDMSTDKLAALESVAETMKPKLKR